MVIELRETPQRAKKFEEDSLGGDKIFHSRYFKWGATDIGTVYGECKYFH